MPSEYNLEHLPTCRGLAPGHIAQPQQLGAFASLPDVVHGAGEEEAVGTGVLFLGDGNAVAVCADAGHLGADLP